MKGQDWGSKGFDAKPIKRSKGTFGVAPNSSAGGMITGSAMSKKGVNRDKAIKHDGIVMGGSVTSGKKSAAPGSINKLSNKHGPNVLGK